MEINENAIADLTRELTYSETRPQWIVKVNGKPIQVKHNGVKSYISKNVALKSLSDRYYFYRSYGINNRTDMKLHLEELIKRGIMEIVQIS